MCLCFPYCQPEQCMRLEMAISITAAGAWDRERQKIAGLREMKGYVLR